MIAPITIAMMMPLMVMPAPLQGDRAVIFFPTRVKTNPRGRTVAGL
jgi:hypothetical protein